jgi:hypothetical protein
MLADDGGHPYYASICMCLAARLQTSPVLHSARCLPSPPTSRDENAEQGFFIGDVMKERWKPIPGYEGQYEVSDQGRVRSSTRLVMCEGTVKGSYFSVKQGRMLKPGRMTAGHLSVALGRRNSQCVHKLVLMAFVGPAPAGCECLHANGNPADNRLVNLRWGTRSENNVDAILHQRRGKLTRAQIKDIRARLESKEWGLGRKLAKEYGVHESTISAIKVRRHYACFVD